VNQSSLFHDTIYDALGADIAAAGGFKVVAGKLWPTDANGSAKLRNSINPDQPHKLCADEVLAIKKLAYEHGSTATVDDEAAKLDREIRDLLECVNRKLDRKARADERLKVVR
jgi:hypothetical protein